jgi:hypothetical protein
MPTKAVKSGFLVVAALVAISCSSTDSVPEGNGDGIETGTTSTEQSASSSSASQTETQTETTTQSTDDGACEANVGDVAWEFVVDRGSDGLLHSLSVRQAAYSEAAGRIYLATDGFVGGHEDATFAESYLSVNLDDQTLEWDYQHRGPFSTEWSDLAAGATVLTSGEVVFGASEIAALTQTEKTLMQAWTARFSANGELLSEEIYDRINDNPVGDGPIAIVIRATADGGYLLAGETDSVEDGAPARRSKIFLRRFDAQSVGLWTKFYEVEDSVPGGTGSAHLMDLVVAPDGSLYAWVGHYLTKGGFWALTKFSADGEFLWEVEVEKVERAQDFIPSRIGVHSDGSLVLTATNYERPDPVATLTWVRAWIARYSSDGERIWQKSDGAPDSGPENPDNNNAGYTDAVFDRAGNIWAAGFYTEEKGSVAKAWVRKFDGSGALVWQTELRPETAFSAPLQIFIDSNCRAYVVGWSTEPVSGETYTATRPFIAKINP